MGTRSDGGRSWNMTQFLTQSGLGNKGIKTRAFLGVVYDTQEQLLRVRRKV